MGLGDDETTRSVGLGFIEGLNAMEIGERTTVGDSWVICWIGKSITNGIIPGGSIWKGEQGIKGVCIWVKKGKAFSSNTTSLEIKILPFKLRHL